LRTSNQDVAPTVSRVLETLSPTDEKDGLDAFERLLQYAGIITRSDPQRGFWASPAMSFFEGDNSRANRMLYTEFFARQWRKVTHGGTRATMLSNDSVAGSWARPYAEAMSPRWDQQIAPAIPLSELIAMTTPISGADYRSFYLTYDATKLRQFRVGESAEIPIADLADAENTIRLQKFGRGIKASYEQMRRMRVDKLAMFIQLAAIQAEIDKVKAGLAVLINGDGNNNAAVVDNLTTLDTAASAGTLTLKGWLAFKMKFANPYTITTSLMQEGVALSLALLNTGSANVPLSNANLGNLGTGLTPINQFGDGVRFGWEASAPALKIVGFDKRFAMEHVTEIGGDIAEMERFITNQTQVMTMSEVSGFAILDKNATRILDVNA
jgi:hypothetical protein